MPAPDMQTCTKIVHNTMLYTVHEMDTALDTALEMDTVGHELILAWVERGQPTSERGGCERGGCERGGCERGGCERGGCEIVREAFLSHPLFGHFFIRGNIISSLKNDLYYMCISILSDFGLSYCL